MLSPAVDTRLGSPSLSGKLAGFAKCRPEEAAENGLHHMTTWASWMELSLEQQHADVFGYLRSLPGPFRDNLTKWLAAFRFAHFAPSGISNEDREVALSNLSIIVSLLHRAFLAERERENTAAELILDEIEAYYADPSFSLDVLSEATGLSGRQIARILKASTGYTFISYVRLLRIGHARRLLLASNADIRTIAFDVGYSEPSWFARHFRMLTGSSPSQYRQQSLLGSIPA